METKVVKEVPVIVLKGYSGYSDYATNLTLYRRDLAKAQVGDKFESNNGNVARDSMKQILEIVYKNNDGVAGLLTTKEYDDIPNKNNEHIYEKLIWFDIHY